MTQRAYTILIFSASAFLLNFFWESWHAVFLYTGHGAKSFLSYSVKEYLYLIGHASVVDALILIGIFIAGALLWKNFQWFKEMDLRKYIYIVCTALIVAVVIEIKGVYLFNNWAYSEIMPTIFGIGSSPLLQLAVTGLISFWLIQKLVFQYEEDV